MSATGTDILLISLQPDLDTVGLKSLHYALMNNGFSSVLLYLPVSSPGLERVCDPLKAFIAGRSPRIVGISLMSHEYDRAVTLTGALKRFFPDTPVLWGGIHPTVAPEMCLDHADYVCVGEGETAAVALMDAVTGGRSLSSVANIWHKKNGEIVKNPLMPLVKSLDILPLPDHIPTNSFIFHNQRIAKLDVSLFKKYARWRGRVFSVMGSRGCPFACTYCCNDFFSRLYGREHVIRRRDAGPLIDAIAGAVRRYPEIRYVNFHDDCFLACSDAYLAEFCRQYKARVGIPFIVRCIPAFFTENKMRYLKDAGVAWISIGLQSGSNRVLRDVYNRRSTVEDFLAAAALIRRYNVAVYYDVILDNPLEAEKETLLLIPVLASAPHPYFLQIFSLVLYPGTRLYERLAAVDSGKRREYLTKDYHTYNNTTVNKLIRISGYLPARIMDYLVAEYRTNARAASFRLSLLLANGLSAFVVEPLTYFRLIRMSRNNRTADALRLLPAYFRVGFSRYIKQFLRSRG